MGGSSFEKLRKQRVETLRITVEEYRCKKTGARHLHMATEDHHNAFLVAFLTVPMDDTGVAHILEHTALCGSERFPVRDPFFMMLRRSLSTFMNAFTASDWTAYPFASQSKKDFNNLLEVYLDSAFFPRLDPLDFSQEGHRVELENPDDPEAPLVFKGVVFNEMKGAMSSPSRAVWQALASRIFPTTTYHYNSGGDPESIPNLTHEGLTAFHAKHYHPSNAIFMTYGDIPASEHQEVFQARVLEKFDAPLEIDFHVPDEKRLRLPLKAEETYALEGEEDLSAKTHVVVGWLLGKSMEMESLLEAHLLSGVLLDNSSSPLLKLLETTDLGAAPSPLCGLDDSSREMVFACGLEGSEPDRAEALETLVMDIIESVAKDGVEPERVEAVLHQLELSRREIGGDGFPFGLKLMLNALTPALHGGDPVEALDLDGALKKLRKKIKDPEFIKGLARELLLDNPHRVRLAMRPDKEKNARRIAKEAARLKKLREAMDETALEEVRVRSQALEARQNADDDPEILPKVTLEDVPEDLMIPSGETRNVGGMRADWFAVPTNGLVYQQAVLELPALTDEQVDLLPLFSACLSEMGVGAENYLETQARQAAFTGGINARAVINGGVGDVEDLSGVFLVGGKALVRNHEAMSDLIRQTLEEARFDELPRLRELVAQIRASSELRITDNGHALAMTAASSRLSRSGSLGERWGGLTSVKRIRALDDALKDDAALAELAGKMTALRDRIRESRRQMLVVGEVEHFESFAQTLETVWAEGGPWGEIRSSFQLPAIDRAPARIGWATSTQVNFCAKAFPTVSAENPDAASLRVLGGVLRNGFLHRAIREQGGAYGGGAAYDANTASFRFYSYRDPRMQETLADFDASVAWLLSTDHEPRVLEEAILGVIGAIDKPGSPAGDARRAFHDNLHGRTAEQRRRFRQRVLAVTMGDLKRVAEEYLAPEKGSMAVVSNAGALEGAADLELEIRTL